MCGLVAVISKYKNGFTKKIQDAFDNLLYIDAVRGEDSTGVFCVTRSGNVHVAKQASDSNKFLKEKAYEDIKDIAYKNGWVMVGHNRKATRGSITDANAHPFWVEDKLVLVHNGSLMGSHKHLADVEVDSNAIAHVLAEEPDTEKALSKINGAYALIWYDIQNKKLNIIRNKERPLWWVETDEAYLIASEPAMLYFACWRNDLKIVSKDKSVHSFEEHMHCVVDMEETIVKTKLNCEYKYDSPVGTVMGGYVKTGNGTWVKKEPEGDACALPTDKSATPALPKPSSSTVGPKEPTDVKFPKDYQPITYASWATLRGQQYPQGRRIAVEIDNYDWNIDDKSASDVFLTGYTMDKHRAFVVFRSSMPEIQRMVKELKEDTNPIYTAVIDKCVWAQIGEGDAEDYNSTVGHMRLICTNPERVPANASKVMQ